MNLACARALRRRKTKRDVRNYSPKTLRAEKYDGANMFLSVNVPVSATLR